MSSGSESDDEYVPGEPEQLSEEDSADDETETQYENEQQIKSKKRKLNSEKKSRRNTRGGKRGSEIVEEIEEKRPEIVPELNKEEEKKREDDLWAKFLEGTDTKRKSAVDNTTKQSPVVEKKEPEIAKVKLQQNSKAANEEREKRIFEFAGETIVVEDNLIKERLPTDPEENSPIASASQSGPGKTKKAGLGNLLGQLNKKNTLSVLEKSKLDWNTYKKQEGVEDEVKSHNKGKHGFLDRRDFLERADLRQYEIERDLRMSKRSNR